MLNSQGIWRARLLLTASPHTCAPAGFVAQALNLFRRKTGRSDFFEVTLDKHVPHGEAAGWWEGDGAWGVWWYGVVKCWVRKPALSCCGVSNLENPQPAPQAPKQGVHLLQRPTLKLTADNIHALMPWHAGAGLGGGSGNAATTLYAANELTGRPATNAQLLEWSGDIGSDISVFFSEGAAYCTGRGEVVNNVQPPLPLDTPLLLVKPPVGLSTPQIFKSLDLDRRSTADPLKLLEDMTAKAAITPELCVNDLEQPAFDNLPELLQLKQRLQAEGSYEAVFMTGSGSTIVCVGSDTAPQWLSEPQYKELFVSPTRMIVRQAGGWYLPSSHSKVRAAGSSVPVAAAS